MCAVVNLAAIGHAPFHALLARYGAEFNCVAPGAPIPGTFWGAPEAGLIGSTLYARDDTPVHSLLHELAHYVCMGARRRLALDTNAGSDDAEECAVCYLQVLLADSVTGFGRTRCLSDMDAWGYSFREGSAARWFAGDGRDARAWLMSHGLIDRTDCPSWQLRGGAGDSQSLVGFGASP